jgi:hypothetical protein
MNTRRRGALVAIAALCLIPIVIAWAEYADVTINTRAETEGVAPVIFPHWFHRIRFQWALVTTAKPPGPSITVICATPDAGGSRPESRVGTKRWGRVFTDGYSN